MGQLFYIGGLEIAYHLDQDISLRQYDARFCRQVLPVQKTVPVDVAWVEELNLPPEAAAVCQLPNSLVWKNDREELRLYPEGKNPPGISSRLTDGRITLSMLESRREEILAQFRPWFHIHLERLLLQNQALILHSASIVYHGEAILFSAPSGTGKTTQTNLWHKFRDVVEDLNGDRTVLQRTDGKWYACGFPIYGSSVRCEQGAFPIRAVVVLRQAKTDSIRELSAIEKLSLLYSQCTVMRAFAEDVDDAMNLLESFINGVTVIGLDCTMEESAVDSLHRYLYGE